MSPLLGGEFVIAFLALRIALWVWRSRADLAVVLAGGPEPDPNGGLPLARPPGGQSRERPRPPLALAPPLPPATAEPAPLPRAA